MSRIYCKFVIHSKRRPQGYHWCGEYMHLGVEFSHLDVCTQNPDQWPYQPWITMDKQPSAGTYYFDSIVLDTIVLCRICAIH